MSSLSCLFYTKNSFSSNLLVIKAGGFRGGNCAKNRHNRLEDYSPYFEIWTDEEQANIGITLCRMVDRMMMSYEQKKDREFVTEGGIRERMTAWRRGRGKECHKDNHKNIKRWCFLDIFSYICHGKGTGTDLVLWQGCGRDVAEALGYKKPENALAQHVEKGDTLKQGTPTTSGIQQMLFINESGLCLST